MLTKLRNYCFHVYFRLTRPMTLGARIIAINENNEICLIKHTYTKGWHLPGGGVEKGETIFIAAQKELLEEAGLFAEFEDLELVSFHSNFHNFKGDHVAIIRAKKWEVREFNNFKEIAEIKFFKYEDLPQDTTKGTLQRIKEALGKAETSHYW